MTWRIYLFDFLLLRRAVAGVCFPARLGELVFRLPAPAVPWEVDAAGLTSGRTIYCQFHTIARLLKIFYQLKLHLLIHKLTNITWGKCDEANASRPSRSVQFLHAFSLVHGEEHRIFFKRLVDGSQWNWFLDLQRVFRRQMNPLKNIMLLAHVLLTSFPGLCNYLGPRDSSSVNPPWRENGGRGVVLARRRLSWIWRLSNFRDLLGDIKLFYMYTSKRVCWSSGREFRRNFETNLPRR